LPGAAAGTPLILTLFFTVIVVLLDITCLLLDPSMPGKQGEFILLDSN
jgi:hypothetical protein